MRIYLAGPMRGKKDHNFPLFNATAEKLRALGHEVFNPVEKGCESEMMVHPEAALEDRLDFRRRVFGLDWAWIAAHADAVAMLPGWEQSRGSVSEHACANALGLTILYLGQPDGWGIVGDTDGSQ